MERPVRKMIRLENYDYSRCGAYFITVCTKDKMCIFWDNNDKYRPLKADHDDIQKMQNTASTIPHDPCNTNGSDCVGAHSVRPTARHKIHLSEFGWAVKHSFKTLSEYYPMIYFDKYVIMPNHVHVIIRISTDYIPHDKGGRTECAPTISQVIKNFKENVTREIGFPVWQKSFYDRIIRNKNEYAAYCGYIERNPYEWESDELFSKE